MVKEVLLILLFSIVIKMSAQDERSKFAVGFNYGLGSEFNNKDYTFKNHFYKLQLYYKWKETKHFKYEILVQPEVNFGKISC